MRKKLKDSHAGARLVERYDAILSMEELRERMRTSQVEYLYRQTATRSVCRTPAQEGYVYFIADRKRGGIVTVLTEAQVTELLAGVGRALPGPKPDKPRAFEVYVVEHKPPGYPFTEVLRVFATLEGAMAFCAKRAGQELNWRAHDAHGRSWTSEADTFIILATPMEKT